MIIDTIYLCCLSIKIIDTSVFNCFFFNVVVNNDDIDGIIMTFTIIMMMLTIIMMPLTIILIILTLILMVLTGNLSLFKTIK